MQMYIQHLKRSSYDERVKITAKTHSVLNWAQKRATIDSLLLQRRISHNATEPIAPKVAPVSIPLVSRT